MTLTWKRGSRALSACAVVFVLAACATTPPVPKSDLPVLIDPRLGFEGKAPAPVEKKFLAAWQKLLEGNIDAADKSFASIVAKNPSYAPATLGRAVVALAKDDLDLAERHVEKAADPGSSYFAAEAYRAEIALERSLTEDAWRNYDRIARLPGAPTIVSTRFEAVSDAWFDELVARANATENERDRVELLDEAVAVRPRSDATRIELARTLVAIEEYTRAREQVGVLLDRGLMENADVQAVLADLEASDGRYQDAIVRLERLARRYPDRGFDARLAEVKREYMRANLPPRYHNAMASAALTRADLAVLAYWHVSAVRFATINAPPIAVDIAGVSGRDEIVKALGLGLFTIDPATRTFGPDATVTPRAFTNFLLRVMRLGPPACAEGRAGLDALSACGIDVSGALEDPSGTITGASAGATLDLVDALISAEK